MNHGSLYNTRHVFLQNSSFTGLVEREKRGLENRQERNNGRLFVNYFLRAEGDPAALSRSRGEGTGVKKKAKIGV